MTNRRQFLERSMLGFGGAFLLPSLLTSCTDHQITPTDPSKPIVRPPSTEYSVDWNGLAKKAITTGISITDPAGGEILSALVDVFWPTDEPSPWDQVKAQVEQLVDQKITDFEYGLVTQDLNGLNNLITLYLDELHDGTNEEKLIQWLAVRNAFANAQPHFQAPGFEFPLLGLFAQFAGMYLSILRDVVIHGSDWGRTAADHTRDQATLTKLIQEFTDYTTNTYAATKTPLIQKTQPNVPRADPFRTINFFDRNITLLALDFQDTWKYYDVSNYPNGAQVVFTREIFTDPLGTGTNPDIPFSPPTGATSFPTKVDVWSDDHYFNGIQFTYPTGGGPGGADQTPKYGSQDSPNTLHRTYNVDIVSNPITRANVTSSAFINTLQFVLSDGNELDVLGVDKSNSSFSFEYVDKAISSVYSQDVSYTKERYVPNNIVFGFRYWQAPANTLKAIAKFYITSPKERSAADFAKSFPKLGITAVLISEELKLARKLYWAALHARALKLK